MRLLPRSLTARLVVTAVALVAVVGVLVASAATLAMRSYLTDKLDGQVRDAVRGVTSPPIGDAPRPGGPIGRQFRQVPGTMIAGFPSDSGNAVGAILTRSATNSRLSASALQRLAEVPTDDSGHTVEVSGRSYRVLATSVSDGTVIVGLPSKDIDNTLSNMLGWFALLTLLGVLAAGGAGTLLVRRQLRPLRQVAATAQGVTDQELTTGDITIDNRVEEKYTDTHNEVGQVGAALNTLLDHVDEALSVRHRSEQQARQFVADASHELRTPLSTIHGYAELSRRTPDDAGALTDAMGKVEIAAGRMSSLVEDLLLLARLDAGRPLERADVDLTRLLLEAVADARVVAPGHHWRLDLADEPVIVPGDEQRLHQVVANLLGNGRSHTPPGTTVTVGVRAVGRTAVIMVHDDGPGMPPDVADHAFERFTRGDSSRTRASGGAGLGLSLVNAIAVAHHGSVSVRSAPGDTTFTVTLPAKET